MKFVLFALLAVVVMVSTALAGPCNNVVPASCPHCRQQPGTIADICKYKYIYTGKFDFANKKLNLERDVKSLTDIKTAQLEWAMGNCNCDWMRESQGVIMLTKSDEVGANHCLRLDDNVILVPNYQLNMFDVKKGLKTNRCPI